MKIDANQKFFMSKGEGISQQDSGTSFDDAF